MASRAKKKLGKLPKGGIKGLPKGFQLSYRPDSSSTHTDTDFTFIDRMQNQHRLYIISRSGSGEAQYVLLNKDRTEITSYGVRLETWRIIKDVSDFGVAVVNNVLYVIGGYNKINCRHLHRVVKYDPFETSWIECAPLLKARAKFGICVLDDKIYVCGGERSDGQCSCSCEVYDPSLDQWSEAGILVAPRKNHCCVNFENELFCGGGDFGTRSHNNFWIYDQSRWEEIDEEFPHCMPRSIDRYAICAVEHKIYCIGGVSYKTTDTGENKFTTERGIFSYTPNMSASAIAHHKRQSSSVNRAARRESIISDISRVQPIHHGNYSPWTTRYPSMVRPRHSCGAHALGSKIYVFGGCHLETGQDVRVCECFDTVRGTWEDEFHFRKGDLSNVVTAVLEVPRRHDEQKIKNRLKWTMW